MTKQRVLNFMNFAITFCVIYIVITCSWVGAEWIVEHTVHTSKVDGFFAYIISYYLTREIIAFDRKYRRRKTK